MKEPLHPSGDDKLGNGYMAGFQGEVRAVDKDLKVTPMQCF